MMGSESTTTIRLGRWIWRMMVLSSFFSLHLSARRLDWLDFENPMADIIDAEVHQTRYVVFFPFVFLFDL